MKILLIIHGLVRPNLESVLEVKNTLLQNFKEHECHTLLSTWFNNNQLDQDYKSYDLDIDSINNNFDYYLIDKQPTKNSLLSQINVLNGLDISKVSHLSNVYGYFHFYKKINLISDLFQDYEYYVFCRSDLKIIIENFNFKSLSLPKLFWKNKGSTNELNDHFFISSKDTFLKTFKNISIENINELSYLDSPEKVFTEIIKRSSIDFNLIENVNIKEYYIIREYRKWDKRDIDELGRDSTQVSIDTCLNIKR
jgi:hypothetical protein